MKLNWFDSDRHEEGVTLRVATDSCCNRLELSPLPSYLHCCVVRGTHCVIPTAVPTTVTATPASVRFKRESGYFASGNTSSSETSHCPSPDAHQCHVLLEIDAHHAARLCRTSARAPYRSAATSFVPARAAASRDFRRVLDLPRLFGPVPHAAVPPHVARRAASSFAFSASSRRR